jgi:outer membrane immunogenic protein
MRKIALYSGTALAMAISSNANAEPFNGPFIGIQAGWTQHDAGTFGTRIGDVTANRSQDSVSGGAFLGYDYRISPRFVIGAEAGLNFGIDDNFFRTTDGTSVLVDPKRSIDLTARAGYLVTDDTLIYARGGYTNARFRTSINEGSTHRSASEDRDGWLVGGGVEHAINPNVTARLEYRYSDLSDGGGKFDRHQVLIGVAYRF